jgi:hypothetical protein
MGALFTQIGAQLKTSATNSMAALKEFASWVGVAFPKALQADWELVKSIATGTFGALKSAFTGFFDWLKEKVNWLGSFVPGWKNISGRAMDIPGMSEHLHGGGGGGDGGGAVQKALKQTNLPIDPGPLVGGGGGIGAVGNAAGHGPWHENLGMLNPAFHHQLDRLAAAARAAGHHIAVMSGFRSHAHQWALWRGPHRAGFVARPGHSRHESGLAADLTGDLGWVHQHAREYGLHFPMSWENWHIEPAYTAMRGRHRQHQSYAPPPRSNTVVVHSNVKLDGRVISQNTERHLVRTHRFAHGTADHDGRAGFPHVDLASNMG